MINENLFFLSWEAKRTDKKIYFLILISSKSTWKKMYKKIQKYLVKQKTFCKFVLNK
jgi:hypothetical protein